MRITSELLEDYYGMCSFVGSLDYATFCAGYWAHQAWIEDYDVIALPLAS